MRRAVRLILCGVIVAGLAGCAVPDRSATTNRVEVVAALGSSSDLPPEVQSIALAVTGEGLETIRLSVDVADLTPGQEVIFRVAVSPGVRTFTVVCYNAESFGLYRGERTITIVAKHTVQLDIDLRAYGLLRGDVYYYDGAALVPLPDFQQGDVTVTGGRYRLEAEVGPVGVELDAGPLVSAGQDLWGSTTVALTAPGEEAPADLVLVDRLAADFATLPWVTGAYPQQGLTPGQTIDVYGAGLAPAATPAVWFAAQHPGGAAGAAVVVSDDAHLQVRVPATAPGDGFIFVCLSGTASCSNPYPYNLAP